MIRNRLSFGSRFEVGGSRGEAGRPTSNLKLKLRTQTRDYVAIRVSCDITACQAPSSCWYTSVCQRRCGGCGLALHRHLQAGTVAHDSHRLARNDGHRAIDLPQAVGDEALADAVHEVELAHLLSAGIDQVIVVREQALQGIGVLARDRSNTLLLQGAQFVVGVGHSRELLPLSRRA